MKRIASFILLLVVMVYPISCSRGAVTNNGDSQDLDKMIVKNTKHFEIHYTKSDEACIDRVSKKLEENYERIVNDLNAENVPMITVSIYPNLEKFHESIAAYVRNPQDWVVGISTSSSNIQMVSPNNPGPSHNYNSIMQVAVHEFTHCVTYAIVKSQSSSPNWLWDSIALYEAGQSRNFNRNKLPTIAKLKEKGNTYIYTFGYSLADYIISRWGIEEMRELVKSNGDIEKTLGISTEEFEKGWREYVK